MYIDALHIRSPNWRGSFIDNRYIIVQKHSRVNSDFRFLYNQRFFRRRGVKCKKTIPRKTDEHVHFIRNTGSQDIAGRTEPTVCLT